MGDSSLFDLAYGSISILLQKTHFAFFSSETPPLAEGYGSRDGIGHLRSGRRLRDGFIGKKRRLR
jgi:hypothetical protein